MKEILNFLMDDKTLFLIYLAVLLLEGFVIKHSSLFKKVSNDAIPFILMVSSIIICIIGAQSSSLPVIAEAIVGALIATGIHQAGKITVKTFIPEFISELRGSLDVADVGDTSKLTGSNPELEEIVKQVESLENNIENIYKTIASITAENNSGVED